MVDSLGNLCARTTTPATIVTPVNSNIHIPSRLIEGRLSHHTKSIHSKNLMDSQVRLRQRFPVMLRKMRTEDMPCKFDCRKFILPVATASSLSIVRDILDVWPAVSFLSFTTAWVTSTPVPRIGRKKPTSTKRG